MKYSIVVPVYNAEKTLRPCIDSILLKMPEDAELILVNDGSTDSSSQICEQYVEADSRVRYLSQENRGVSVARNRGIRTACGKYILFVDSDDRVTDTYFDAIAQAVDSKCADYTVFSNYVEDQRGMHQQAVKQFYDDNPDIVFEQFGDLICRQFINSPCAKVYKRAILDENGICFPEGYSIAEDWAFNILYAAHCGSCQIINEPIYIVNRSNEASLSRSKRDEKKENQIAEIGMMIRSYVEEAPLTETQKDSLRRALNFGQARKIYSKAKSYHVDGYGWLKRNRMILALCSEVNRRHYQYPKTKFCKTAALPVQLYLSVVIDYLSGRRVK